MPPLAAATTGGTPGEKFEATLNAFLNLKKAEIQFKVAKRSDAERSVMSLVSQSQGKVDPDALLGWKQSVLTAEAKREELHAAFQLGEEELLEQIGEYLRASPPATLEVIDAKIATLHSFMSDVEGQEKSVTGMEKVLRGLRKKAQELSGTKRPDRKGSGKADTPSAAGTPS
jgi:hypothetical protein